MSKIDAKILVIDDDRDVLTTSRMILKQQFSDVITLERPDILGDLLKKEEPDVIILDMNFQPGVTSGEEGILWLKKILRIDPSSHVLMITAYGDIDLAVKAMKLGAIDFLVKPWYKEKLLATIMSAYRLRQAQKQVTKLKNRQNTLSKDLDKSYTRIIAHSKAMKPVLDAVKKVAPTDACVLILGENGTGKELIARAIHRESLRGEEPFIAVDLGAIPDTLFESELFGHTRGAFTDAKEDRAGRFEIASGGTLFLDEIGNLSLPLQSKLLTVIQNNEVIRVGSNYPTPINIRLICATNKPVCKMAEEGGFRQDLLYRINTVEINLPPLRERTEDIVSLSNYFLNIYKKKYDKPDIVISPETYKKFKAYTWPGNIRELKHAVERAVIMSDGPVLDPADFILGKTGDESESIIISGKIGDYEKTAIENALKKGYKNMDQVAEELGLSRSTLYRKMKKYGL